MCYAWLFELVNHRHKSWTNTCLNLLNFMTIMFAGIYFLFISKDWAPLFYTLYFFAIVSNLIVAIVCPESPMWLLLQGKRQEAIKVLNYMAWFNGSKNRIADDTEFVESAALAKKL